MSKISGLSFQRRGWALYACWAPILLIFLLLHGTVVSAQSNYVLSQKVSYKVTNLPMGKALKELRTKAKLKLSYNTALISQQPSVTIDVKDVSLGELLKKLLSNTNLVYELDPTGGITIYEKETPSAANILKDSRETRTSVVLMGRVTDPSGNPLSGVSIRANASKLMTVTQPDGLFTLVPYPNEEIIFSRLGMKSLVYNVKAGVEGLVEFKMDTVAREIKEVVVNGYQKIDPRLATGSVFKLKAADIIQPGVASVDQMLQGKVPGMMIVNTTGSVNGKPTIRLRGTSTLLGNAQPLWVIDGMVRPDPVDISSAVLNNMISSASQSNFELMGNAISGLNPYDIESITVLKDAAATAIYGTSAANGVIVVTTKRGKSGPAQVSYNTSVSYTGRPSYNRLNLMNSKERLEFSKQMQEDGIINSGVTTGVKENISYEGLLQDLYARNIDEATFNQKVAAMETRNTDWFKLLFRSQLSMQHSLSVSGGNDKTTYYASLNYTNFYGAATNDSKKTYGANVNLHSRLSKRLTLDVTLNSNFSNSTGYYRSANPLGYALQTNRGYSPDAFYPQRMSVNGDSYGYLDIRKQLNALNFNILNEIAHTENTSATNSTSLNVQLDYKIGHGWFFRNSSSAIINNASGMSAADDKSYYIANLRGWNYGETPDIKSIFFMGSVIPYGGIADMITSSSRMLRMVNTLEYSTSVFNNRDQVNFSIANEVSSQQGNSIYSTQPGYFPDRGKAFFPADVSRKQISNTTIMNDLQNTVSLFSTAAYNLMNRYIFSGTIRSDGSNRFGQYSNGKFLPNYSISGRWNAAAEKWFPVGAVISDLGFTVSYGTQGNVVSAVGPELIATYASNGSADSYTNVPYLRIKTLPYPNLRWEKTGQWNFGTNAFFLDGRLTLSVEYFRKKTVDVLDNIDIPLEYGRRMMYRNGSDLFNSGVDVSINATLIRRKYARFSMNFIAGKVINRVSDQAYLSNYAYLFTGTGHLAGKAVSGFYSYIFKGLDHNTGLPTFDKINQAKASIPDSFLVYSGQTFPKFSGSITPTFTYKSFSISASLYVSLGSSKRLNDPYLKAMEVGVLPAPYTNVTRDYFNRWRKPGDEQHTNVPAMMGMAPYEDYLIIPYATLDAQGLPLINKVNPYTAYNLSDIRVVRNDYLRCNAININYGIPASMLAKYYIKGATAGFSVNNVFTIANKQLHGQDPEIDGVGSSALPKMRQYAFSLSATF
ncbi:SusC/RagA family TonB-linked outer membrane protein [Chitinophaga sp. Cy-1792]|uniref:SusC/RagA family TonB-linked outer membrane protein n=1 Tax=Chitinophaga sp. Cy-1792 TaxID=2608339 RepID=UPI001423DC16|nr:SusC/RagA family TonB-linked outer membrane protein [Chitinophaga sp. Cy-1792]NIG54340.1 SusC/RagA family TonB-linked outer membrane protein [Chitinophaga sp. Cy-1792]